MNQFNHLLTLPLHQVQEIMEKFAQQLVFQENAPPGVSEGQGQARVIAIKRSGRKIKVIWCYENYS